MFGNSVFVTGGSLFGSSASNSGFVGVNVEDQISKVGQPRLKRWIKESMLNEKDRISQMQFQLTMIIPTNVFLSKSEQNAFFEEIVTHKINRIHNQIVQLRFVGKKCGFIETACKG